MTLWARLKALVGLGDNHGSKKKPANSEVANDETGDARWSVAGRKHTYEECHPEEEDDKPDPEALEQYKVNRAPRQYEDIDKDYEQQKAESETKDSNNARLSQKQSGELNYVDVEFTKPKKKKKSKKDKESDSSDVPPASVEYSEVVVQNSKPMIN